MIFYLPMIVAVFLTFEHGNTDDAFSVFALLCAILTFIVLMIFLVFSCSILTANTQYRMRSRTFVRKFGSTFDDKRHLNKAYLYLVLFCIHRVWIGIVLIWLTDDATAQVHMIVWP